MVAIATAHLRLQRAENHQALNDPSQQWLYQANCRDLTSIKTSYEDDHLLIKAHGDEDTSFNKLEHSKRLEKFYVCHQVAKAAISFIRTSHARVALPVIKLPIFSGESKGLLNSSNLFTTLIGDNKDLSKVECFTYLKPLLSEEPLFLNQSLSMTSDNFDIDRILFIK
ncbi:hypothetical protein PR048_023125, partial [Dryococelus australis]